MIRKDIKRFLEDGHLGISIGVVKHIVASIDINDDEESHVIEDMLHQRVLLAYANGETTDPNLAKEALKTNELKFSRWYV